ncbi:mitochondrial carrier [Coprinopsis marcescibilis]|uniref:Mitochondrial carrier n=1 Tax=Coprinopsis marcescibilis TaxID=230819 RepID=A0A5C3L0A2_COPMA|nr:mitochondrial carrier [Coprinopsis marcescibilis]
MTSNMPPLVQAVSGAVGSVSASALTYPLDLITTRLQLDSPAKAKRRGGLSGGVRLLLLIIYGNKRKGRKGLGWSALYDGFGPDMSATVLSSFFYFYFYSFLRSLSTHGFRNLPLLRNAGKTLPSKRIHTPSLLEELLLGFIAGVASRAVSTPLNIITLRLQAERSDADDVEDAGEDIKEYEMEQVDKNLGNLATSSNAGSPRSYSPVPKEDMGVLDIAKLIYDEKGWKGFWKGFGASALLSINPSISLAFFQLLRNIVVYSRTRRSPSSKGNVNLKPWEAFFVGATASSVANTILYPLILAKKRLQSSSGSGENLMSVLLDAYAGKYDPHRHQQAVQDANGATLNAKLKRPALHHLRSRGSRYNEMPVEGFEGLYQGLQMQLFKGFFNQGVTYLVKGRIEQLVVAAYLRQGALKVQ